MKALAAAEPFTILAGRREAEREMERRTRDTRDRELLLDLRTGITDRLLRSTRRTTPPKFGVSAAAAARVTMSAGVTPPRVFIDATRRGIRRAIFPMIPISLLPSH